MFQNAKTFSSFSTNDLEAAKKFYGETLALTVREQPDMGVSLELANGAQAFIYPKADHVPATFTVLNFMVDNIDAAVDTLVDKGVVIDRPDMGEFIPDAKGIYRSDDSAKGPNIAWFKDPAGNVLSVLEQSEL